MIRPILLALALAAPAGAEGIAATWTPRTADEAAALRLGIALYGLRRHVREGGDAEEWGRANLPRLLDPGSDWALVHQEGEGHAAGVVQRGGGNAAAVIQLGEGREALVEQDGGDGALVLQWGG